MGYASQKCPGCRRMRGIEEFCGNELDYDPQSTPPVLCDKCRKDGPKNLERADDLANIHIAERRLIAALMEGKSPTAAAKEAGMDHKRALKLIRGESKPIVRATYQRILEEAGLTLPKIATVLAAAIDADKPMWNPAEQEFTKFPDHNVRLKAASTAANHLDIAEPDQKGKGGSGTVIAISIQTNLDGPAPSSTEDAFVARAKDVTPHDGA